MKHRVGVSGGAPAPLPTHGEAWRADRGNVALVHPIERLRYVARAGGADPSMLVEEAAGALATFADEQAALVTACRRLVDRHAKLGAMWWLAARVLASGDPVPEADRLVSELEGDPTARSLAAALPDEGVVVVVGWQPKVGRALRRRGDQQVRLIDTAGVGVPRGQRGSLAELSLVPPWGIGAATAGASLVLLEATALGEDGFVAQAGSWAAAAVARSSSIPVWVVAGHCTVLPGSLWKALRTRLDSDASDAWEREDEIVPLALADAVVGPTGPEVPAASMARADCPVAPELLKPVSC